MTAQRRRHRRFSWPNEAKFHDVFNTPYAPWRMPANSRGGLEADRRWRSISAATTAPPVGDRSEHIACFARALALGQTKPGFSDFLPR